MAQSRMISIAVLILAASLSCVAADGSKSLTIVFKDGHQNTFTIPNGSRIDFNAGKMMVSHGAKVETIPIADVLRIDFASAGSEAMELGRNHFLGKWRVGDGNGRIFVITLDRNGQAHKSMGPDHGTWVVVGNEARITWDDGWHDAIRKVGDKHEKFAYSPGTSFDDEPSNVTDATSLNKEPI